MKKTFSVEFLEKLDAGQKEFSNLQIEYADLSGKVFEGMRIRDAKIIFSSLRNSKLKDTVFENCEMLFLACGYSELRNVKFINCRIDYSGFTECIFNHCQFINTNISWTSFIDAKLGGAEFQNCTEFKVFRSLSELDPESIQKAAAGLGPIMQHLDYDTRNKVMSLVKDFAQKHDIDLSPASAGTAHGYKAAGPDIKASGGYRIFDSIVDAAISKYGTKNPYKGKDTGYEAETEEYKSGAKKKRMPWER